VADDGYTTILRTTDPVQGEVVAEMLRREGIDARFHKVSSTLIGMPGNLFEMTVDVPTEREALARELLADLEFVGASDAALEDRREPGVGDDEESDETARDAAKEPLPSRRHPLFAAAFAFFLPGGGHLYARQYWTALLLAGGGVVCLTMAVAGAAGKQVAVLFTTLGAIVVCDAVAGVRAARAEAKGRHRSRGGQLLRGVGLLCLAGVAGTAPRLVSALHEANRASRLAELGLSCTTEAIAIANRGTTLQVVDVWDLQVEATSELGSERYGIGTGEARRLTAAPGAQGAIPLAVPDWLARSCHFSAHPDETKAGEIFGNALAELQLMAPRPSHCGYIFNFVLHGPPEREDEPIEGWGDCVPSTPPHPKTEGQLHLGR
jgi:hypothetical protein